MAPKGSITYTFTHMGNFLLLLLLLGPPLVSNSRPKHQPQSPNTSLEAQIIALRHKCQPSGPNPSLKTQIAATKPKSQPHGPIQASKPKSQLEGLNCCLKALILEENQEGERENSPHICVREWVIEPFGATALHPPSASIRTFISKAHVLLTI